MLISRLLTTAVSILLLAAAAAGQSTPYRRLFLDPLVIEQQAALERVFHACRKYSANPVLIADTPWERGGSGPYLYGTILRDEGKLRMWYHFVQGGYRNAYAESADGIHWTKPDLGIVDFQGSKANNIFARNECHNPSVILRPLPAGDPQRYALFCWGADVSKVRAAFSPDGLHWKFVPETAKRGLFESSDVVNFFYDPYQQCYTATWKGATRRGRSVGIATSQDALHWTKPAQSPIFTADDLDPPDTQIYGMPVFPYEGLYIGLPWIYHADVHYPPEMLMTRAEAEKQSPCTVDVQMAWSWDLINWTRPPARPSFIPRGPKGSFDSDMIYTARAPIIDGDKLIFYYGGFDQPHNAKRANGAIGMATLRLDGFVSMHAGPEGGWLVTRREKIAAPEIKINAVTSAGGEIRAEILDLNGNVIPGFSQTDSIPFQGDAVRHTLRWKTPEFQPDQKNTVKKIRFVLKNADLYSYLP